MPVFSLPGKYGIGCFSEEAYRFVDFLKKSGQKLWQILPLGPTGYGDSPYQCFSTFAGNPYFIDLEDLVKRGYLNSEELDKLDFGDSDCRIDYEKQYRNRGAVLRKAFKRSNIEVEEEFQQFRAENSEWLPDYALYMAIKDANSGISWDRWDDDIRLRRPDAIKKYQKLYAEDIQFHEFTQYLFAVQWRKLKRYANDSGIEIVGDLPIYVAFDSADTWACPELFQLNEDLSPVAVAGCPPDAFSRTGQLWGNPLYDWEYHKRTGFRWWMKRFKSSFALYDRVRIDHFRGFDEYYSIPSGNETAEYGQWEKGPGFSLFQTMFKEMKHFNVIAEDLGFLTPSVLALVEKTKFPGMKVLQFAFDSDGDSVYLPHNYNRNCVVYTGTHDNDTTLGWYKNLNRRDKRFFKDYLHISRGAEVNWLMIRTAFASVADTAIIPMADYLGCGSEARINVPSTLGNNWKWRMQTGECTEELAEKIHKMVKIYSR